MFAHQMMPESNLDSGLTLKWEIFVQQAAKVGNDFFKSFDRVGSFCTDSRCLYVELFHDDLRGQIELVYKKLVRMLAQNAIFIQAFWGKMPLIESDDGIGLALHGTGYDMSIILVWTFECLFQSWWYYNQRFRECFLHHP